MKKAFGWLLVILGSIIFYLMWFELAPFITSLIPKGEYQAFLELGVYFFVAWIGGIAMPFFMICLGLVFINRKLLK